MQTGNLATSAPAPPASGRAGHPPVPIDPALPGIGALLDADAMSTVLHRALGSRAAPLPHVRPRYLRYKPQTNLVVHYDVGLGGAWHEAVVMIASREYHLARRAMKPDNKALARLVEGRSPAPNSLVHDPELDALIQWLPLDLALPALAEPPARLRETILAAGVAVQPVHGEPERLAYKPRRRVVLRFGDAVIKHYADEDEFRAAAVGLESSARLRLLHAPKPRGVIPALRLTVQDLLPGSRLSGPADVAVEAGEILATLHAQPHPMLRPSHPPAHLRAAANSAGLVAALAPGLAPRLERLLRGLEETIPEGLPLVTSHGDFNARQLLVHRDEIALIDFDAMSAAPAALDLATYTAHLVLGGDGELAKAEAVLAALLEGYGARPGALSWYLATSILRRSSFPFRYLDEHWPERLEGMVEAAETALAR